MFPRRHMQQLGVIPHDNFQIKRSIGRHADLAWLVALFACFANQIDMRLAKRRASQAVPLGFGDVLGDRVGRRVDANAQHIFDEIRHRRDPAPADEIGRAVSHWPIGGEVLLDRFLRIEHFDLRIEIFL
jgi:hypothetical protein